MKTKIYLFLTVLLSCNAVFAQTQCEMVYDTASRRYQLIRNADANVSARVQAYDIDITVTPSAARPESMVHIRMDIGPGVNIDSIYTLVFTIWPDCQIPCNEQAIGEMWLSTSAIDKLNRTVDLTMGGMLPGKRYRLETSVFGLEGAPCGGNMAEPVTFQTGPAVAKPTQMLMVIDEVWRNVSYVQSVLDQYITDVQTSNPRLTVQKYYIENNGTAKMLLYNHIRQQYLNSNLSYLFFIGDNASTEVRRNLLDEAGNVIFTAGTVSFTHYTLPWYQHYSFSPETYVLESSMYHNTCYRATQEVRQPVFQQRNSLISMGMVIPDPALSHDGKANYIVDYFNKLRRFRNKEITFQKRVLLADGFAEEDAVIGTALANGRWLSAIALETSGPKDPNYSGDDPIWKSDFLNRLGNGSHEIFSMNVHGSPTYHAFGIYSYDLIYNLLQLNTQLLHLASCNVGHFKSSNYMAGLYLEKGNVINVHAYADLLIVITSNGASGLGYQFMGNGAFTLMSQGHTVSDAYRYSQSYIDSEVILGDPLATLNMESALPVTLRDFDVSREGRMAMLKWSTTSETNSRQFDIERSSDGKQWKRIGEVQSAGESVVDRDYFFQDNQPLSGWNLYRLKMIDHTADGQDGAYAYSRIRTLDFGLEAAPAFPNPAFDRIYFAKDVTDHLKSLRMTDAAGKVVLEKHKFTGDGIAIRELHPGLYLLQLTMRDGQVRTEKIAVTR
ncbi:MAG: T9SS type A sorting domain-containing protein [Dyadobacter sp.]|uniref:T9SS type A sorting domain-containing protein n=1 Tax=Dyadobacter sp. TaxID=1914288 RepID=UPI001B0A1751|nr:T9SS type A sorting domain-containing protein [Dyadobacter sp.]MBO9611311.1 T9SS type A sorting domain-containing protein [Dyadobacter sp.]